MGAAIKLIEHETEMTRTQTRRTPRANAYLCIDLCSEHNFWTGLTMNLSEGGVFVATHVSLPVGSLVGLHLELPRHPQRIMTLGEVRWSRAYTGDDDVPPGLGIQFVGLDEPTLRAIRRFVTTIREPLLFER
ncbi:MAG: PilZ domain-containing protein [Labilithrix sp.]|nr:PilZ domain-containing protein [Labilithrix sp.]